MGIQSDVDKARVLLKDTCGLDVINDVLAGAFVDLFRLGGYAVDLRSSPGLYTEAVRRAFYATNEQLLDPKYRECALLALLACQGAEANLALHIFIALMAEIKADDIVDIIFLSGIYGGANLLTKNLRVVAKTFDAVITATRAGVRDCGGIFGAILAEFPDPAFDAARERLRQIAAGGGG